MGEPAVSHDVGTVARIIQVNRIEGDRFFVSAVGERRFRVIEIIQRRPFISAQVELLDEYDDAPEHLIIEATDLFGEYARFSVGTSGGWVRETRVPSDPRAPLLPHRIKSADGPLRQAATLSNRNPLSGDSRLR